MCSQGFQNTVNLGGDLNTFCVNTKWKEGKKNL